MPPHGEINSPVQLQTRTLLDFSTSIMLKNPWPLIPSGATNLALVGGEKQVTARFLAAMKMQAPKVPWSVVSVSRRTFRLGSKAVPHGGTALQGASRIFMPGGEPKDHEVCARNDTEILSGGETWI